MQIEQMINNEARAREFIAEMNTHKLKKAEDYELDHRDFISGNVQDI